MSTERDKLWAAWDKANREREEAEEELENAKWRKARKQRLCEFAEQVLDDYDATHKGDTRRPQNGTRANRARSTGRGTA